MHHAWLKHITDYRFQRPCSIKFVKKKHIISKFNDHNQCITESSTVTKVGSMRRHWSFDKRDRKLPKNDAFNFGSHRRKTPSTTRATHPAVNKALWRLKVTVWHYFRFSFCFAAFEFFSHRHNCVFDGKPQNFIDRLFTKIIKLKTVDIHTYTHSRKFWIRI
jgi:hypothetical protein